MVLFDSRGPPRSTPDSHYLRATDLGRSLYPCFLQCFFPARWLHRANVANAGWFARTDFASLCADGGPFSLDLDHVRIAPSRRRKLCTHCFPVKFRIEAI